jgi:putative iron-dependent peroxidase
MLNLGIRRQHQDARELLSGLAGLQRSVGFRVPDGKLSCVVGVGSQAWDRLFGGRRPLNSILSVN